MLSMACPRIAITGPPLLKALLGGVDVEAEVLV